MLIFPGCTIEAFVSESEGAQRKSFRFEITVDNVMIAIEEMCRADEEDKEVVDDQPVDHSVTITVNGSKLDEIDVPVNDSTVRTIMSYLGGKRLPITFDELYDQYAEQRIEKHGIGHKQIIDEDFHYLFGCFSCNNSCDDVNHHYCGGIHVWHNTHNCCKWNLSGLFTTDLIRMGYRTDVLFIDIPLEII